MDGTCSEWRLGVFTFPPRICRMGIQATWMEATVTSGAHDIAGCLSGVDGISGAVMSPTRFLGVFLEAFTPSKHFVIIDLVMVVAGTSEDTLAAATDRKAPRNYVFERSVRQVGCDTREDQF